MTKLRALNFQIARNASEIAAEYTKPSTEKIPASTSLAAPSQYLVDPNDLLIGLNKTWMIQYE